VHDIADYMLRLMNDPELRKTMGQAGRERAVGLFDYRKVADRLLQILSNRFGIP
jgi:glycosyltransferase involved in cell wall biosynthesis